MMFVNSEMFFDTLLHTSPDGVLFIDAHGKVVKINAASKALFGYSNDDYSDCVLWDLPRTAKEKQSLKELFKQILKNQPSPRPYYGQLHDSDDSKIPICLTWNYVVDNHKALQGLVCIIKDMTNTADNNHNPGPTIIEQVQYSRLATIEEVVARISHELNQPLSAIVNYSGGTLRRLETEYPNSDIMQSMKMILRQAKRAGDVIERMKMFLKKGELRKESLNINDVIKEVVECMRPELYAAGVCVDLQLNNLVPAIYVDKIQIEQVLLNLIQNGLESMRETELAERALVIETYTNNMEQIAVKIIDNGHGISEHDRDKIFESFFTTKPTGMGIGLAISQSIMIAHGGKIIVEAAKDKGSVFVMLLNLV